MKTNSVAHCSSKSLYSTSRISRRRGGKISTSGTPCNPYYISPDDPKDEVNTLIVRPATKCSDNFNRQAKGGRLLNCCVRIRNWFQKSMKKCAAKRLIMKVLESADRQQCTSTAAIYYQRLAGKHTQCMSRRLKHMIRTSVGFAC